MIGQKFGLLTVLGKGTKDAKWRMSTWECRCDCGVLTTVYGRTLRKTKMPSCGCVRYGAVSKAVRKYHTINDYLAKTKPNGTCLEWQGHLTTSGYGFVGSYTPKVSGIVKRSGLVHRRVYELVHGYAPVVVMHTCDNRLCVNPAHLKGGTQKDNIVDAGIKGRMKRSKRKYTAVYEGETIGLSELSKRTGIPLATLQWRARNNRTLF